MRLRNPDFITLYTHENDTKTVPGTQAAHGDAFRITPDLIAPVRPRQHMWK